MKCFENYARQDHHSSLQKIQSHCGYKFNSPFLGRRLLMVSHTNQLRYLHSYQVTRRYQILDVRIDKPEQHRIQNGDYTKELSSRENYPDQLRTLPLHGPISMSEVNCHYPHHCTRRNEPSPQQKLICWIKSGAIHSVQ